MREHNIKGMVLLALFAALSLALTLRHDRGWALDLHSSHGRTNVVLRAAALRFAFAIEQPCSKTDSEAALS